MSYFATFWATLPPWAAGLLYPDELSHLHPAPYWAMLNPSELRWIFWTMLYLTEPRDALLSYAGPYWAMLHLLSYTSPYWVMLHPAELCCTPYGLAHPNWATLHPIELRMYTNWTALYCTELFSTLWATQRSKCRNAGLSGTGIRVPQSGTGMLDAITPMPATSASMPMPSYAYCTEWGGFS